MRSRRTGRILLFSGALLAFILTIGIFILVEHRHCMGVPLIQESKLSQYTEVSSFDVSQLRFNGEKVAADIKSNTIYISQALDQTIHYATLQGILESTNPNHTLYFVKNTALTNLGAAVETGTPLSLEIVTGNHIQSINVVITTLPVIKLDGTITHENEENRSVFFGTATIWCGFDPFTNSSSVITSDLQWHVRGNTTASAPKKPWKLSFKDQKGENKNLNLLGLGGDDDWILNSLTMDDTRIREKLFMDLWNTISARTDYNYKMSTGEYVEVVINGEYMGLYLMQRRLDTKYLELSDEDVILKATTYQAKTVEEAYEFVTPKENAKQIYEIMQGVFGRTDSSGYNLHNVIDTNLMLQLANARDNVSLKNMYHILKKTDDGYKHYLVPWDTDQSFGIVWKEGIGFCYDYEQALGEFSARMETPALMKIYPDYQQEASERWNNLRQTIFTEDHILFLIDELYGQLRTSGAFARDCSKWSNRYGGTDTISQLKNFVRARLVFVDEYYRRNAHGS